MIDNLFDDTDLNSTRICSLLAASTKIEQKSDDHYNVK